MPANYYGSKYYGADYFASGFYRKSQDRETIRQGILNKIYERIQSQAAKVYINRRLPIRQADDYGISVNWSNEQTEYNQGALTGTPQHRLIVSIAIAAKAVSAAQPVTQILDSYSADVETALYLDQTFNGLATGMEIDEYTLDLDQETESTAGTLKMQFSIFYNAVEGFPKSPIT